MTRHAAGANPDGRSATAIVEWYWAPAVAPAPKAGAR